ncbi:hypothetical protein ACOJQI_10190 [Bacillus salacetis]|uniref:hypothetical protein n=1 Tax=Bacillus salacetis TaxID=2315464 RepID=UPI003BA38A79
MTFEMEQALFSRELGRLKEEYQRCDNHELKKEILEDIDLLSSVVIGYNTGDSETVRVKEAEKLGG